jgi:hypothetical protein
MHALAASRSKEQFVARDEKGKKSPRTWHWLLSTAGRRKQLIVISFRRVDVDRKPLPQPLGKRCEAVGGAERPAELTGPRALASASGQAAAALARRVGVGPTQLTPNCKGIRHRFEPGSRLLWRLRCPSLRALQTSMFPILGTYCAYWACFSGCQVCTVCAEYAPRRWNSPVRSARQSTLSLFISHAAAPLETLSRSVSEGVEPFVSKVAAPEPSSGTVASVVPPSRKVFAAARAHSQPTSGPRAALEPSARTAVSADATCPEVERAVPSVGRLPHPTRLERLPDQVAAASTDGYS